MNSNNAQPEMSNYKVFKTFRDLSDMAQEHFDEHSLPRLKRKQTLDDSDSCDNSFQGDDDSSLTLGIASFFRAAFVHVLPAIGNAIYSSLSAMMSSLSSGLQSYSSASQQRGRSLAIIGQQQEEINELKAKVFTTF